MYQQATDPNLITILTNGLKKWRQNEQIAFENHPTKYHQLIQEQNAIGWRQLFNGRWSTQWAKLQHQHYKNKKKKRHTADNGQRILFYLFENFGIIFGKVGMKPLIEEHNPTTMN